MRFGRVATPEGMSFCVIESAAPQEADAAARDGAAQEDNLICRQITGTPFTPPTFTGKEWPLEQVKLLAPMLPGKVVAIGRNYADHVAEVFKKSAETLPPTLFIKPPTAVIGPGSPIKIPEFATNVEFEGELALIIGKPCKNVSAQQWRSVVLGYTVVNDVSSRDLQFSDGQWARAKGIDTFCPLGPWVETDLDAIDPTDLPIRARLTHDGVTEVKQDSNSNQMIMDLGQIIEFITASMTLLPGDVVCTGSPAGTAEMVPGDFIEIEIPGIGKLGSPVERA
ncbi:fumarylacetoacetate hydrolase family protein [Corynebacterium uberis]|uniref:fumarylacetoacetate hydrolase family protein n=1 Tax=Corynebacterium TaxID=1716 RepID=UPI001D0AE099|nr:MULTISPECIES: fumarylacetoacetate hydrolase family protein [Corynebacterium]MCZ9309118.1 fumarylacetoacetate hydrolase family protein [Corynebacterium sp. c6VSa_13]UDL74721.1 fumarylacetoacetate hydrolase family protein [Corynebacterium uberis]UDL76934.1 fumarylacetoacetate hydrolase family protein [Corynebacterium uberis]UDL78961.1 fumarylacetoacetate hydrolase family protein [Corynebacterium uberis]UDL81349.1 fumarylacetoacetate hydrolase family protein [Corynebacterium uberis]